MFLGYFSGVDTDSRGAEPYTGKKFRTVHRRRGGGGGWNTEDCHRRCGPLSANADMGAHCCYGVPPKLCHRALGPQQHCTWRLGDSRIVVVAACAVAGNFFFFLPPQPRLRWQKKKFLYRGSAPLGQKGVSQVV